MLCVNNTYDPIPSTAAMQAQGINPGMNIAVQQRGAQAAGQKTGNVAQNTTVSGAQVSVS